MADGTNAQQHRRVDNTFFTNPTGLNPAEPPGHSCKSIVRMVEPLGMAGEPEFHRAQPIFPRFQSVFSRVNPPIQCITSVEW